MPRFKLRTLLIVLTLGPPVLAFPPQRLSGDWTDGNGNRVSPSFATLALDRFEFGYLPHFKPLTNVGRPERDSISSTSTVSTPTVGPYTYSTMRWVVDWGWVTGMAITLAVLVTFGAMVNRANEAREGRPASS